MIEPGILVEIVTDAQIECPLDHARIRAAVIQAANSQGYHRGQVGVRITDDATIHRINVEHLDHDYPTDVISFDYRSQNGTIEGEMVVSVDTALARSRELGWALEHELTLYLVHGTLHIAGLDDQISSDRSRMRAAERQVMRDLGIETFARFAPDVAENLERSGADGTAPLARPTDRTSVTGRTEEEQA
jgi:probable rRNA maturation factor